MKRGKGLLLVDGYNVLRSGSRYQPATFPDYTTDYFNQARERLINDVARYAGANFRATIVFDAAQRPESAGQEQQVGNVRVIFSATGQSADKVIERLARVAREQNIETMVVTSDASIQDTVFGGGVDRMSAEGFSREMAAYDEDSKLDNSPEIAFKRTVAERIDPRVREQLIKLRDSAS